MQLNMVWYGASVSGAQQYTCTLTFLEEFIMEKVPLFAVVTFSLHMFKVQFVMKKLPGEHYF